MKSRTRSTLVASLAVFFSAGALVCTSVAPVASASSASHSRTLGGLVAPSPYKSQSLTVPKSGGLKLAVHSGAGATFTLDSLSSCRVGDGLAVVKNTGRQAIRVTAVNAVIPREKSTSRDRTTFQLLSLRPRSTTGEVGALFNLKAMGKAVNLGSVIGAVLKPVATGQRWYAIVARIRVLQNHPAEWVIRGIKVTLKVGRRTYHVVFPQTVRLPATTRC
jgi:hypothetical protein